MKLRVMRELAALRTVRVVLCHGVLSTRHCLESLERYNVPIERVQKAIEDADFEFFIPHMHEDFSYKQTPFRMHHEFAQALGSAYDITYTHRKGPQQITNEIIAKLKKDYYEKSV